MALKPTALDDLAQLVLACVCAALDETAAKVDGQPGCPDCRTCVVAGAPAWDDCDSPCDGGSGGQLTVNISRMYPTTNFPTEDREVRGLRTCTPPPLTAVDVVVTLLRCVPTTDEGGCAPTCGELAEAARVIHIDAVTVYNAMLCCFPTTGTRRRGQRYVLGQSRILDPQGGCGGIEQRITVALDGCGCPTEPPP